MIERIIFFTVLILFLIVLDLYIWSAFKVNLSSHPLLKYVFWSVTLLTIIFMYYPAINTNMTLYPGYMVVIFGFIFTIISTKFVMAIPLIVDDIIRLFRYLYKLIFVTQSTPTGHAISRFEFLKNTALTFGAILLSLLSYGILVGRYNFKKHFVTLGLESYPKACKPLRIIQLSDLHLGSFQNKVQLSKAVKLVNEEAPDLIFFTGDLVNNYPSEASPYVGILSQLTAKYGKFAVLGNHDYSDYIGLDTTSPEGQKKWNDNLNEIKDIFKTSGFDLLLNEHRTLSVSGVEINVVGVENWGEGRFSKYGDLDKAMANTKKSVPTFLLSHDPTHWHHKVLSHPQHIDLQMAGHTHGMQFGIEVGQFKWSPAKWRYKHWAGLYQKGKSYLYVNRGIGHIGYPGRVGIMPEITIVDVQST